jgi:predicted CXXCH cytochrome family protein
VECHTPHAGALEHFLRAPEKALCGSCHEDLSQRLQVEAAHAPVESRDGCTTCHESHVSRHASLLAKPQADGCLECHDGQSTRFAEAHLGYEAGALDCVSCHDPHSSSLEGMLLPQVHPPFATGDCAACHEGQTGGAR